MDLAVLRKKELEELGEMSSTELYKWKAYLKLDRDRPSRSDYYLAQIAKEVRTVLMKSQDSNKVKVDHFILKFKEKVADPKLPMAKPLPKNRWGEEAEELEVCEEEIGLLEDVVDDGVPEEVKRRTIESKAFWFALTGIKKKPEWGK